IVSNLFIIVSPDSSVFGFIEYFSRLIFPNIFSLIARFPVFWLFLRKPLLKPFVTENHSDLKSALKVSK
ncbi:ArsB/NhaD family transporter, partial [Staphylococcus aureus]